MRYLTIDEVIRMHGCFIERFGGLPGIRDRSLLLSALAVPGGRFFGKEPHATLYEKAAAYLYHIVRNHPFNDGNKRVAFGATVAFLKLNGASIAQGCGRELEELVVQTAAGERTKEQAAHFLKKIVKIKRTTVC